MKRTRCDVLVKNIGQLLTVASRNGPLTNPDRHSLGIMEHTCISIKDGKIKDIGGDAGRIEAGTVVDAYGCLVLPGFIDAHTHAIFGGSREMEFSMRVKGKDYLTIMEEGGGIRATVSATRKASKDELFDGAIRRLNRMVSWGTTTCEVKSGYGLSTKDEIKTLEVAQMLQREHCVDVVPTFLGAHEIPEEYEKDKSSYIAVLANEMIPQVAERKLARFCDVFCEQGLFTKDESEQILKEGARQGMAAKVHADEFSNSGGSEIADRVGAVTCDHLLYTEEEGLASMKRAGTIAVLLPGANLYLMKKKKPPVERMRALQIPIAIASDFNPGSSPVMAMPVIMSLACLLYGVTVEEAIAGATLNAAYAVQEQDRIGSIETGKDADIIVTDVKHYEELPYWFAQNCIRSVLKAGRIVVDSIKGGDLN
jgi:imidazolonepropionase